jgi:hypothetical protein
MTDLKIGEFVAANPALRVLPWPDLAGHAPSGWVDTLTVRNRPVRRAPGTPAGNATAWSLRVTAPSPGRFTFPGSSGFAVSVGAPGRAGNIDVDVVIRRGTSAPTPTPTPSVIGGAAWEVDVRGDVALVLHHDALVPVPRARRGPITAPIVPIGSGPVIGLRGILGQLRQLAASEIAIPLGASTLRLRPGPTMTAVPALDLEGQRLGLGKSGVVVSVSGLAPTYSADRLSLEFLGARLALAGRRT